MPARRWRISTLKVESMVEPDRQTEKEGANPIAAHTAELVELKRQLEDEIGKRRRAEESARQLRLVLDGSADAVFLVDRVSLKFADVNETACKRMGYSREELLAMGPADIYPHQEPPAITEMIKRMAASGETTWILENVHGRKDGSTFPVELHIRLIESGGRQMFGLF